MNTRLNGSFRYTDALSRAPLTPLVPNVSSQTPTNGISISAQVELSSGLAAIEPRIAPSVSMRLINHVAVPHGPFGGRLTKDALALHERTYDRLSHACQAAKRAIDLQTAGSELHIYLPLQCYTNESSQLDGWLKQQTKQR